MTQAQQSRPSLRLEVVTPKNVADACRLAVRRGPDDPVAPVAWSLAEAYASPDIAWPRLVYDGDRLVGFVMGAFDPGNPVAAVRCGIWRLAIAAGEEGKGYGRFAVQGVCAEALRRGERRLTVLWDRHDRAAEDLYRGLGFRPTGELIGRQMVGERVLDPTEGTG